MAVAVEALESVESVMAFDARDWSVSSNCDAWLYAILVGWDDALDEVARKHDWKPEGVARLRRYRAALAALAATKGSAK